MIGLRHVHSSAMTDEKKRRRRGFTLIELLMVIALIGVLASVLLVALYAAAQVANVRRTEQQIERINSLLMRRWNSYEHKRLPVRLTGSADQRSAQRLLMIRELMRMEMPDRISDLLYDPVDSRLVNNVLWNQYRRSAGVNWDEVNESAECLYLILGSIREGDRTGLDFFTEDEIGDTDGDGMYEILDGWGKPMAFLRWAPGFSISPGQDKMWGHAGVDDDGNGTTDDLSERGWVGSDDLAVSQRNIPFGNKAPDPFDLLDADTRNTFALHPLVFSAGPDGYFDVFFSLAPPDQVPPAALRTPPNDPFHLTLGTNSRPTMQLGTPYDRGHDGNNSFDNITNH
ncbi:MAG: prepilin-type N-terminal cleavage/methylation domain-containing protein [Planctomycetota bacterium]|nr:prepilin-type N-terminal cleavage/methylation domain-containing protein [Planctomycetota bacterium]